MNHPRSLFLAFTTALVLGATSSGCAFVPVRAAVPLAKDAPTSVQATGTAGLTYVPNLVFGGAVAQPTLEAAVAATHRFDAGDVAVEPTLEAGIVGLVDDKGRAVPAALATGAGTRMWLSPDAPLTLGAEAHATAFAGVDKPVLLGAMLEMRGLVAWRVAPPLALYARPGVVMSVLPLPAPILELPVGATVDLGPVRLGAEAAFGHGLLLMYAPSLRAGVSAAFAF